jgi:hypothetical protein
MVVKRLDASPTITQPATSDLNFKKRAFPQQASTASGSPGDAKHRPETRGLAALLTMRAWQVV